MNGVRDLIKRQGSVPQILPERTRRWQSCFSKSLYKDSNGVERKFCRLKDDRLATRYNRTASLAKPHGANTIMWRL